MLTTRFPDQPAWRWAGIAVVMGVGLLAISLCFRLSARLAAGTPRVGRRWLGLLKPLSSVAVTPAAALILDKVLRISGSAYDTVTLFIWGGLLFLPRLGHLDGGGRLGGKRDTRGAATPYQYR